MDQLINAIGVLGAYFAVVLVLAIVVESIIDLLKLADYFVLFLSNEIAERSGKDVFRFGGLLRERVSPEQMMKDIEVWIPQNSQSNAKVAALIALTKEVEKRAKKIESQAEATLDLKQTISSETEFAKIIGEKGEVFASALVNVRKHYEDNEARRIIILRTLSAIIGVMIASLLQINTFVLLSDLFSEKFRGIIAGGTSPTLQWGGIILTGIATSAGSSFWHDQLDRLRAIKESARNVQESFSRGK